MVTTLSDAKNVGRRAGALMALIFALATLLFHSAAFAQTGSNNASAVTLTTPAVTVTDAEAADDIAGCTKNLKIIYEAIQAYQMDHRDLPMWLSDLVPTYLNDANVLVCPASRRSGQTAATALADPKIPSSYIYQFSPAPLVPSQYPAYPPKTYREWKRRQMGLAGSIVPLVVCRHHAVQLNLAFDGRIYQSHGVWETTLTNQFDLAQLRPQNLFAEELKQAAAASNEPVKSKLYFPPRPPKTPTNLLDLKPYYTTRLRFQTTNAAGTTNMSSLAVGVQEIAGTKFDVRGMLQVGGKAVKGQNPRLVVKGIKVNQRCQRLEFLQGSLEGSPSDDGKKIGTYTIHFATNHWELEIPVIYGHDLRNWQTPPSDAVGSNELPPAWTGTNVLLSMPGPPMHFYKMIWENVAPKIKIESIDFTAASSNIAPFVVAITAE